MDPDAASEFECAMGTGDLEVPLCVERYSKSGAFFTGDWALYMSWLGVWKSSDSAYGLVFRSSWYWLLSLLIVVAVAYGALFRLFLWEFLGGGVASVG